MSGYGGQPPYGQGGGWQDPYGQGGHPQNPGDPYGGTPYGQDPSGYGQVPYGAAGYGQPGVPPYSYGPPGFGYAPASTGPAIAALIMNVIAAVTCYGILAAPGIVTAALAINRAQSDPESARRLTRWSWGIFAAAVVVGIALLVLVIVLAANSDPSYPTNTY